MTPPGPPASAGHKSYDEAYFTRWYHDPRTRVHSPDAVRRKVRMVLGVTEYFLRRKLRSVLDVGAGEGRWGVELRRLRPGIRYLGLDPSEFIVRRHGRRRNIRQGSLETLGDAPLARSYDLVICADMLQYVPTPALKRGLRRIAAHAGGVAFLEAYTSGDDMEGDLDGWHHRSRSEYRRIFADAGLVACGLHCYLSGHLADRAVELELA